MQNVLIVGEKKFQIPGCTLFKKFESYQQVDRDPEIFAFVHRWLQGYPAHLPAADWQILCLLDDCDFYGIPVLHSQLLHLLAEQDSTLGRKAAILLENPGKFKITYTWEKICDDLFENGRESTKQCLTAISLFAKLQDNPEIKLLSQLVELASKSECAIKMLHRFLVEKYGMGFINVIFDKLNAHSAPNFPTQPDDENKTPWRKIPPPK